MSQSQKGTNPNDISTAAESTTPGTGKQQL